MKPCESHILNHLEYSTTGDKILVCAGNAQPKVIRVMMLYSSQYLVSLSYNGLSIPDKDDANVIFFFRKVNRIGTNLIQSLGRLYLVTKVFIPPLVIQGMAPISSSSSSSQWFVPLMNDVPS